MSEYYGVATPANDFLAHYGVHGMKWGIRKTRPATNGRPMSRSEAYQKAQKKLARSAGIAGTIGGIAGGLTKGYVGGAIGGVAGTLAGAAASRIKNRELWKKGAPTRADYNKVVKKQSKSVAKKPIGPTKEMQDMKRKMNKGAVAGALTVGGGLGGSALALAKYKKQNPKAYANFKKRYKQMSVKERMKYAWS